MISGGSCETEDWSNPSEKLIYLNVFEIHLFQVYNKYIFIFMYLIKCSTIALLVY